MHGAWRVVTLVIAALLALTLLTRFLLIDYFFRRAGMPLGFALLEAVAIAGAGHLARRRRAGLALSFAIGYPIFGTICFLVGLLKVNAATMLLVTIGFALAGIFAIYENRQSAVRSGQSAGDLSALCALPAALSVLILGFVAAQAPPFSIDELSFHLAVPHAWVVAGRAIALPLISHSHLPLGIESADLPPLTLLGSLAGGIASHFIHLIAAIAATVIVQRRTRNPLLTAAIVTTPALALTAGWSLIDWPLLAICVAFLDEEERESGLAAGLLTSFLFVPFAVIVLVLRRQWRGVAFGALAGSVFFIRNIVLGWTLPYLGGYRSLTLGSYIFDTRYLDESLGASLLAALTAISAPVAVALFVGGALLWAIAPSARLLLPFFGAAATDAKLESRPLRVILVVAIVAQLFLAAYSVDRDGVFSLLAAKETDEQFLTKALPSYASISWLNATLPQSSCTLVVGVNETYWFNRRVLGGVSEYLETPTPEALRARLAQDRVDHIAVFAPQRQTLTPAAQKTLALVLDRYAADVTSHGDVTLFTLR